MVPLAGTEFVSTADEGRFQINVTTRQRLAVIPGIEIGIIQEAFGGGASPIQLSVLGDDQAVLKKTAAALIAGMHCIEIPQSA
jgi:hypothetical protein